jgi:hypothetical protein
MIKLKNRWKRFNLNKDKVTKTLKKRGAGFTLLSFLEKISKEIGVNETIQYMKPIQFRNVRSHLKPMGIEMSLLNIDIRQLVALLHKIECSDKLLNVRRIKISRPIKGAARSLKVNLQVTTYTAA